jgi:hypothetical protein
MHRICNMHERVVAAPAPAVGALLDGLGGDPDLLWPGNDWPPLRLDGPLASGASGGHGPMRYAVTTYEPGRRVRFGFLPGCALVGYHELRIEPGPPGHCLVRHVLCATPSNLYYRVLWCLVLRWLHDACIEDLLDNAGRVAAGPWPRRARPRWVRVLRRAFRLTSTSATSTNPEGQGLADNSHQRYRPTAPSRTSG